jgi:hypothetical protein
VLKGNHQVLNTGKEGLRGNMNLKNQKSMNLQGYFTSESTENETCKQGEASTSTSPVNRFKLGLSTADYNVKEKLECQSDFSEVFENTQPPQTAAF